jgi:hypothetical protein
MIVEMREYTLRAGKVPEYLQRYEREGLAPHPEARRVLRAGAERLTAWFESGPELGTP